MNCRKTKSKKNVSELEPESESELDRESQHCGKYHIIGTYRVDSGQLYAT